MQSKILVMIVYPHRKVPVFQPIKNNTATFHRIVGRNIERVEINDKFAIIYDKYAEKDKEINLTITNTNENIYGTVIVCRIEGKELKNLTFQETYEVEKLYIRY